LRRDELAKENAQVVPTCIPIVGYIHLLVATLDSSNEKLKFRAKLGTTMVIVFTTSHQKSRG
jgi:hypothetical protein